MWARTGETKTSPRHAWVISRSSKRRRASLVGKVEDKMPFRVPPTTPSYSTFESLLASPSSAVEQRRFQDRDDGARRRAHRHQALWRLASRAPRSRRASPARRIESVFDKAIAEFQATQRKFAGHADRDRCGASPRDARRGWPPGLPREALDGEGLRPRWANCVANRAVQIRRRLRVHPASSRPSATSATRQPRRSTRDERGSASSSSVACWLDDRAVILSFTMPSERPGHLCWSARRRLIDPINDDVTGHLRCRFCGAGAWPRPARPGLSLLVPVPSLAGHGCTPGKAPSSARARMRPLRQWRDGHFES